MPKYLLGELPGLKKPSSKIPPAETRVWPSRSDAVEVRESLAMEGEKRVKTRRRGNDRFFMLPRIMDWFPRLMVFLGWQAKLSAEHVGKLSWGFGVLFKVRCPMRVLSTLDRASARHVYITFPAKSSCLHYVMA